ncbi:hypothetical protein BDK51DRAFT_48481 [Blyttiomyces helicus]|uniref:Uncharacterized protein n=1 Tax=Blyttiomyces helicus TaxID=388810 RepID=A0A4V1IQS5_9FUNG|nr:hypothetical protein BDK51DRAFT_48481 [Blyttiomyces helicus]|eukprot:RKO87577.1 hypothetical protein BDK51DRAFT_48481 [Blyttiomyces helicus]
MTTTHPASPYWAEYLPARHTDSLFHTRPPPARRRPTSATTTTAPRKTKLPTSTLIPPQILTLRRVPARATPLAAEVLRRVGRGSLAGRVRFRSPLANEGRHANRPFIANKPTLVGTPAIFDRSVRFHVPDQHDDDDDEKPARGLMAIRHAIVKAFGRVCGRRNVPRDMPDTAFVRLRDSRVVARERLDAKVPPLSPVREPIIVLLYNPDLDKVASAPATIAPVAAPVVIAPPLATPAPANDWDLTPSQLMARLCSPPPQPSPPAEPQRSIFARFVPRRAPSTSQGSSADTVAVTSAGDLRDRGEEANKSNPSRKWSTRLMGLFQGEGHG